MEKSKKRKRRSFKKRVRKSFRKYQFLIGILLGSILPQLWQIATDTWIASRSGLFDKPEARLQLAGSPFIHGQVFSLVIGGDFSDDYSVLTLPLNFYNPTSISIRSVLMSFRYDNQDDAYLSPSLFPYTSAETKRTGVGGNGYSFATYRVPELHPGLSYFINEPLIVEQSNVIRPMQYDSVQYYDLNPTNSIDISILLSARDSKQTEAALSTYFAKADSVSQLMDMVMTYFEEECWWDDLLVNPDPNILTPVSRNEEQLVVGFASKDRDVVLGNKIVKVLELHPNDMVWMTFNRKRKNLTVRGPAFPTTIIPLKC